MSILVLIHPHGDGAGRDAKRTPPATRANTNVAQLPHYSQQFEICKRLAIAYAGYSDGYALFRLGSASHPAAKRHQEFWFRSAGGSSSGRQVLRVVSRLRPDRSPTCSGRKKPVADGSTDFADRRSVLIFENYSSEIDHWRERWVENISSPNRRRR